MMCDLVMSLLDGSSALVDIERSHRGSKLFDGKSPLPDIVRCGRATLRSCTKDVPNRIMVGGCFYWKGFNTMGFDVHESIVAVHSGTLQRCFGGNTFKLKFKLGARILRRAGMKASFHVTGRKKHTRKRVVGL